MTTVKPGDEVTQHRDEIVIYQLKFADWSADLERPENKDARITSRAIRGEALNMRVLPYAVGSQQHEVRVTGGGKKSQFEIVRVVKSKTETRRRSFIINVSV